MLILFMTSLKTHLRHS